MGMRLGGWVDGWQGLMRVRGRPAVAYDQQGLVFAVAMEGGAVKLFDSRSYEKVRWKRKECASGGGGKGKRGWRSGAG